jgi:hypothetical protein
VLTAGRRSRHEVQLLTGLDLIPEAGFDQIEIVSKLPAAPKRESGVATPRSEPTA